MTLLVEHARTDKFSNREFFDHIAVCGLGTTSTKPKPNPFDRLKFLGNNFPTGFQGSDPSPPISFHLKLLEEDGMKDESVEVDVKEESILIEDDPEESIVIEDEDVKESNIVIKGVFGGDESIVIEEDEEANKSEEEEESNLVIDMRETSNDSKSSMAVTNALDVGSTKNTAISTEEVGVQDPASQKSATLSSLEVAADPDVPMVQIKIESNLHLLCETKVESTSPDLTEPASLPPEDLEDNKSLLKCMDQCSSLPIPRILDNIPATTVAEAIETLVSSTDLEEFANKIHEKIGQQWFDKISAIEAKGSGSSGCEGSPQKEKKQNRSSKEKTKLSSKELVQRGKNKRTIRRKKTKQQNRGLTQGTKIGGPFFCPHTGRSFHLC